jgi:hypothetical protein
MIKKILILTFGAFLLFSTAEVRAQDISRAPIESDQMPISITVTESTVHIKNADKKIVSVINMTGVEVMKFRCDSPSKTIELAHLPKGCYIIKIGNVARKVYLR